jgi:hypothetical protein
MRASRFLEGRWPFVVIISIVLAAVAYGAISLTGWIKPINGNPFIAKSIESAPVDSSRVRASGRREIADLTESILAMKAPPPGESMEGIILTVSAFESASSYLQRAQYRLAPGVDREQVAKLRRALILRQRQIFPVVRDRIGPIFRQRLWKDDIEAETLGNRFTTVEFVGGTFAAHANILDAFNALRKDLVRFRFERARYAWIADADDATTVSVDSPADGDVAIVDEHGYFITIPDLQP